MQLKSVIFWFRRDLRLNDNAGLYHALKSGFQVIPLFIFDQDILEKIEDKTDLRVNFIHQQIEQLNTELLALGSGLMVKYGKPLEVFQQLLLNQNVEAVYTNHDYEPYAINRDQNIADFLATKGAKFHSFKDQCIFEKDEVR